MIPIIKIMTIIIIPKSFLPVSVIVNCGPFPSPQTAADLLSVTIN